MRGTEETKTRIQRWTRMKHVFQPHPGRKPRVRFLHPFTAARSHAGNLDGDHWSPPHLTGIKPEGTGLHHIFHLTIVTRTKQHPWPTEPIGSLTTTTTEYHFQQLYWKFRDSADTPYTPELWRASVIFKRDLIQTQTTNTISRQPSRERQDPSINDAVETTPSDVKSRIVLSRKARTTEVKAGYTASTRPPYTRVNSPKSGI